MAKRKTTPASVANEIRRALKAGGSSERSSSVQRFFKEDVQSHGWRTADLRRAALAGGVRFCNNLISSLCFRWPTIYSRAQVNEEKNVAVFLLENITVKFGDEEFRLLESWLPRISNWSDHDALVHYLIAPMMVSETCAGESGVPLGKVAKPLVSPGRLRSFDPGNSPKNVFFRNHQFVRAASVR